MSSAVRFEGFGVAALISASNVGMPACFCTMRVGTCTPFMFW